MTVLHHTAHRRASEGTLSARQINRAPLTPDPYLLDTQPRKAPPKLRLIRRPPDQPSPLERSDKRAIGIGQQCSADACALSPSCADECRYRQADEALRSHYGRLHTQRQDMPPTPAQVNTDHSGRRVVWALLIAWCIGALGIAAWVAWDAVRALLTV